MKKMMVCLLGMSGACFGMNEKKPINPEGCSSFNPNTPTHQAFLRLGDKFGFSAVLTKPIGTHEQKSDISDRLDQNK